MPRMICARLALPVKPSPGRIALWVQARTPSNMPFPWLWRLVLACSLIVCGLDGVVGPAKSSAAPRPKWFSLEGRSRSIELRRKPQER
jgi:hypothetical protein